MDIRKKLQQANKLDSEIIQLNHLLASLKFKNPLRIEQQYQDRTVCHNLRLTHDVMGEIESLMKTDLTKQRDQLIVELENLMNNASNNTEQPTILPE